MEIEKVSVLGAGESGVGAAILAKKMGFEVFVSDQGTIAEKYQQELIQYQIDFEEKQHTIDKISPARWIIKSPGIPETSSIIQSLQAQRLPIISEIEFASKFSKGKMIGITGSNGKTTTTLLTHHLLQKAGLDVGICGNIGKSLARQVAEKDHEYYVLELSSFQLDGMFDFKADFAILTNITPDHLDRYNYDFQQYIDSKFRILQNQTAADFFIFWDQDPIIQTEIAKRKIQAQYFPFDVQKPKKNSVCFEKDALIFNLEEQEFTFFYEQLPLKGLHNYKNSAAAIAVALLLKIEISVIENALKDFKNAPHRLEKIAEIEGVTYINDSKATNVDSTFYALEAQTQDLIWIAGGVDKGNDYEQISDLVQKKVKILIALGTDNQKLIDFFQNKVPQIFIARSMEEAINLAKKHAKKDQTVLLSPCCASFDLFKNYEHRGDLFRQEVLKEV